MLNDADASGFKKVYLAMGFTDLRRGIDGLANIVRFQFQMDPYDKNTLFLFCGRKCDRIKALLWEGDGFLLMYKRLDNGAFRWPRSADEAMAITEEQYRMLSASIKTGVLPEARAICGFTGRDLCTGTVRPSFLNIRKHVTLPIPGSF